MALDSTLLIDDNLVILIKFAYCSCLLNKVCYFEVPFGRKYCSLCLGIFRIIILVKPPDKDEILLGNSSG